MNFTVGDFHNCTNIELVKFPREVDALNRQYKLDYGYFWYEYNRDCPVSLWGSYSLSPYADIYHAVRL